MTKRFKQCGLFLPVLLASTPTEAQEVVSPSRPAPTAKEVYLGCSLLIRDEELASEIYEDGKQKPYSSLSCGVTALLALGYQRKIKPGNTWEYCMPENASTTTNRLRAMAATYVDFYDRQGSQGLDIQGLTMMLIAFKTVWPCPK